MSDIHIGCGIARIYAGKIRTLKDGTRQWVGEKSDVTDEAIGAVAQHLLMDGIESDFEYKGKKYTLKVVERKDGE